MTLDHLREIALIQISQAQRTNAMNTTSWIVEDLNTGKAVLETFNRSTAAAVNAERYKVWATKAWLVEINRRVKAGDPSVLA